ncbi:hypothetical protein R4315_26590 [Rhodococcus oxybenzonivorans]|uniref:Serine aminopeptidase S33 domain-containing protein n=1 Tax=Rhodococcus oxybenzonivorans TaxID=1990687 RepID=A0AAE4V3V9_9NOCA|nr:hypothetical protein [Rhodococcus oxybenzonivorans]MDV7268093.1 hypothetical protein [Rhodococcus oxybenzonivorans]
MNREDIEFQGEGDVTLRGWFYPAQNTTDPAPVIILVHGMSGVKEMHLDDYASVFAEAGLNAIAYDHQNFGDSDGTPAKNSTPSCSTATSATRSATPSPAPRSTETGSESGAPASPVDTR